MNKIMRVGTIDEGGVRASIYIHATDERHYLSITGVIGPLASGDAHGGCGQIDMGFWHRNPEHNDKRGTPGWLIKPVDIKFARHWTADMWLDLLDIWSTWHLKDNVPQEVIDKIQALPDTDRQPAWV